MPHVCPGVPPPPEYPSLSAFYTILLCKSDVHPWENILLFSWVTILCPPVHRDTRSPLCHCSCLCYLFGIYTLRTGKKSSVCHPEWASDRMPIVRLQFPPIWWLSFKWTLLNSYKIHRSRQNLDKLSMSLWSPPETSVAARSSVIFSRRVFNQHIFILIILPGIPILQAIMGI